MNCYLCQIEKRCEVRLACAVCQRCGAGMCSQHLVVIQPVVGMAGSRSRALICMQCSHLALPLNKASSTHQPTSRRRSASFFVWPWFRTKRNAGLPEPQQAVVLVEQFLKRQLKP